MRLFKNRTIKRNGSPGEISVVIAAAGASGRMQGIDKLTAMLDHTPVLVHSVLAFDELPEVREIIVVAHEAMLSLTAELFRVNSFAKLSVVIAGGKTRDESVYKGVMACSPDCAYIAVHDGARPLVTRAVIDDAITHAKKYGAAAPAIPVTSTVKEAKNSIVTKTVDRANLFEIQTPQIFDAALIRGALLNAKDKQLTLTDDCMAVEAMGATVSLSEGSAENIKITTKTDLLLAGVILRARKENASDRSEP